MLHRDLLRTGRGAVRSATTVALIVLSAITTAFAQQPALAAHAPSEGTPSHVAADQRVIISDILPNPPQPPTCGEAGGTCEPEWVELFNDSQLPYPIYVPIAGKATGERAPVGASLHPSSTGEIAAVAKPATDISGWQLGNDDDRWYTIPDALPPVPYGARVRIYFDGTGPANDDYDFSDNLAVLHTPPGLTNIFPDLQGQAALYAGAIHTPQTLRYRQAWHIAEPEIVTP